MAAVVAPSIGVVVNNFMFLAHLPAVMEARSERPSKEFHSFVAKELLHNELWGPPECFLSSSRPER